MRLYSVEHGTLWVQQMGSSLPPKQQPRIDASFAEVGAADLEELAAAMNLPAAESIQARFQAQRRCFSLKVAGEIAAYGLVSRGVEYVGELERHFHFGDDEAYIWDCTTLAKWRGQRLYTALLSHIIHRLRADGLRRVWIGASRLNQPSVQGFQNAGFVHVLDLTYRRFYRLTMMRLRPSDSPGRSLFREARQVLLNEREWRIGPLAIGFI